MTNETTITQVRSHGRRLDGSPVRQLPPRRELRVPQLQHRGDENSGQCYTRN
jgi:hypothetical protein